MVICFGGVKSETPYPRPLCTVLLESAAESVAKNKDLLQGDWRGQLRKYPDFLLALVNQSLMVPSVKQEHMLRFARVTGGYRVKGGSKSNTTTIGFQTSHSAVLEEVEVINPLDFARICTVEIKTGGHIITSLSKAMPVSSPTSRTSQISLPARVLVSPGVQYLVHVSYSGGGYLYYANVVFESGDDAKMLVTFGSEHSHLISLGFRLE